MQPHVRHNVLVSCGVTISGWPSLVRTREADHHWIYSSDPWPTCSYSYRETKLQPHMISLVAKGRHTSRINMAGMSCSRSPVQCASICGKTRSKLAYALMLSTKSGHRLLWYSRCLLKGHSGLVVTVGRTGCSPPSRQRSSKTPSGCSRMLPKLLQVGARLASAQTGTIAGQLGLTSCCFVPLIVSQGR